MPSPIVREFYENEGWTRNEDGVLHDTNLFVDLRPVCQDYLARCMTRVLSALPREGKLFLDLGSGPMAFEPVRAASTNFAHRVCVDIASRPLRDVRAGSGGKIWCVQADAAHLPFKHETFDAILCTHVLYHLPVEDQALAFNEVARIVSARGRAIVVYAWPRSLFEWFAETLNPRVLVPKIPGARFLWRRLFRARYLASFDTHKDPSPPASLLYVPQPRAWLRAQIDSGMDSTVTCAQAASLGFMQAFVTNGKTGTNLLRFIAMLEDIFPRLMGRLGRYPLITISRKSQ